MGVVHCSLCSPHSGAVASTPKSAPRPSPSASTPAGASSTGKASPAGSPSPSKAVDVDEDGWETVVGKKPAKANKRQQPRGYQGRR